MDGIPIHGKDEITKIKRLRLSREALSRLKPLLFKQKTKAWQKGSEVPYHFPDAYLTMGHFIYLFSQSFSRGPMYPGATYRVC